MLTREGMKPWVIAALESMGGLVGQEMLPSIYGILMKRK